MSTRTREGAPPRTAYTAQEVAESLGVPVKQIYALCRARKLRHRRIGKHIRIPVAALAEFLADADRPAGVS
ncbi:helix-turn-helix domain-containing protein [Pseudonocardia hispaniensis]|uniref:Helix-turn-helix domain-containing protein n=1 Tax=Pseudonocardia hispaniensis TaxID=904933 RepID=A0ABW1IZ74_9PSEU